MLSREPLPPEARSFKPQLEEARSALGAELREQFKNDLGVLVAPGNPVGIIGHDRRGEHGQQAADNQLSHVSP